jgi:hypothetical protein
MIQAGIVNQASSDSSHKFKVTLYVDEQPFVFIVANDEKIPYWIQQRVKSGDGIAQIFEFEPEDQFAYVIAPEDIIQIITNVVEETP